MRVMKGVVVGVVVMWAGGEGGKEQRAVGEVLVVGVAGRYKNSKSSIPTLLFLYNLIMYPP